jgi:threonine dehydrogenase-like Zn-dependent dehydrogenase
MEARAAVTVDDRAVEIVSLRVPDSPPPGGALLRVTANGLCGSDYDLYSGHLRRTSPDLAPLPLVSGHEAVGVIEQIDDEAAASWAVGVGDRVAVEPGIRCGRCVDCRTVNGCRRSARYSTIPLSDAPGLWGGNAEYMVLRPGTFVLPVPDALSDEDATLYNPLGNAVHWTVTVAEVKPGDRVLVLGAGQRGFACAAVARDAGAERVFITGLNRDQEKRSLLARFGADALIDAEAGSASEWVLDVTDGAGVDVVIDTVPGATAPTLDALAALRRGGRLVMSGIKNSLMDGLDVNGLVLNEHQIRGVFGSSAYGMKRALRMLADGRYPFTEMHSHTFGLDQLSDALEILGGGVPGEMPLHITIKP